MRKLVIAAACSLLACSSSSDATQQPSFSPPEPVALATRGNVVVGERVPLTGDESAGLAPGVANAWDLDQDFSLSDGWDDQFDGALRPYVGALATSPPTFDSVWAEYDVLASFPYDQLYDELAFYGPVARAADGAVTAVVAAADPAYDYAAPLDGTYSAYLLATSDSRLSRSITLPAATGGATITLSWVDQANTSEGYLGASSPDVSYLAYFRVAVRAANGDLLDWALPETSSDGGGHAFDLTSYAGQTVTISFEYRSNMDWDTLALVDDVAVVHSGDPATNLLTNGDFETGDLTGWTASDTGEPTGIASGARTVGGLEVQRFFYTVPGKSWARWADVYSNPGASAVTTDVVTYTNLGSDDCGFIYPTPGAAGKAVTEWDTGTGDRDVGLAFGDAQAFYQSDTDLGACAGSDNVFFVKHLTVPAGGKAVLVHFIVMDGTDTGLVATDLTARATGIDGPLAAIVAGVRSDPQYLAGLTAAQIAAIANW